LSERRGRSTHIMEIALQGVRTTTVRDPFLPAGGFQVGHWESKSWCQVYGNLTKAGIKDKNERGGDGEDAKNRSASDSNRTSCKENLTNSELPWLST
jgi:hypothetical protein